MSSLYWLGFKKILGFLKKALIVFVVYIIVISLFFYFSGEKKSYNQKNIIDNYRTEIYRTINDPELNKNEAGKIAINIYRNLLCGLIGEACTDNPSDGDKNFDHSLFGFATKLITLPAGNPPASASYWAYSGLVNAGFIPKTYAATVSGIGLTSLAPIATVWMVFRNLLYMLFVLVIIAIGFMIMFRMKINPQTVISLENSLPKIIIALLLITFSLPIAGFLIDLMYILCGLIILIFHSQINIDNFREIISKLLQGIFNEPNKSLQNFFLPTIITQESNRVGEIAGDTANAIYQILPDVLKTVINFFSYFIVYKVLGGFVYYITGKPQGIVAFIAKLLENLKKVEDKTKPVGQSGTPVISLLSTLITIIVILLGELFFHPTEGFFIGYLSVLFLSGIFLASLLFIYFRIFFMLLYSYIQIVIFIIFSPVFLALEAIPGKSTFSGWLKTMIYHLSTWPLLIVILLINQALMLQIENNQATSSLFLPPFVDINSSSIIYLIVALLLFLTPDIIKNLKEMMGLKPQDIGISLGAVFAGGAAGGGLMQLLGQYQTISMITGWNPIANVLGRVGKTGSPQGLNPELKQLGDHIIKGIQEAGKNANQPPQGGNS